MRPALTRFLGWVRDVELKGRPDAARVAAALGQVAERIVAACSPLEGRRVLDLGSGTGVLAIAAASAGAAVTAVDIALSSLARGREPAHGLPVRFVAGDAGALPLRSGMFDVSIHRSVLVYMEERARAVADERRVLRPGGTVSCSESLGAELDLEVSEPGLHRAWRGGLREILHQTASGSFTFSAERLHALYAEAGFEGVRVDAARRALPLDSGDAVGRAFAVSPPSGRSARERWIESGVPHGFADEFLARLALEAESGRRAELIVAEGFLTARAPA